MVIMVIMDVAPTVAASNPGVSTSRHLRPLDSTPTTAGSQVLGARLLAVVPRRPTPHHLSGTKIGRARTRLAASGPAKRTASTRVLRGATARDKGHVSDLRRRQPTVGPANRRGGPPRADRSADLRGAHAPGQRPCSARAALEAPSIRRAPDRTHEPTPRRRREPPQRALASRSRARAPEPTMNGPFAQVGESDAARLRRRPAPRAGAEAPRRLRGPGRVRCAEARAPESGEKGAGPGRLLRRTGRFRGAEQFTRSLGIQGFLPRPSIERQSRPTVGPGRWKVAPTGPSRSPPALQVPRATFRLVRAPHDRPPT